MTNQNDYLSSLESEHTAVSPPDKDASGNSPEHPPERAPAHHEGARDCASSPEREAIPAGDTPFTEDNNAGKDNAAPSAAGSDADDETASSPETEGDFNSEAETGSSLFERFLPEEAGVGRELLPRALGIRLRKAGQVFFFPDEEHTVRIGSKVVVALEQGPALGEVESIIHGVLPPQEDEEGAQVQGRVVGLATAQDIALHAENSILAAEASAFCKTCIRQRKLEMKLVDVEVLHDRSKIIFFFTAPSRIDFRELVKDLVRNYRTRIELRQIGVRHETQMVGGLGNCGMVCCCHSYLRKFAPVTIKMAKEQNLFLNPAKLSGMCGRLLCCLSFEQSNYEEFNRRCPKLGKKYSTSRGTVKVLRANLFSQSICVLTEVGEETELSLEEWDALEPRRAEPPAPDQQRAAALRGERPFAEGRGKGRQRDDEHRPEQEDFSTEESAADSGGEEARYSRSRRRRRRPDG